MDVLRDPLTYLVIGGGLVVWVMYWWVFIRQPVQSNQSKLKLDRSDTANDTIREFESIHGKGIGLDLEVVTHDPVPEASEAKILADAEDTLRRLERGA